jgi:hypothetical protein
MDDLYDSGIQAVAETGSRNMPRLPAPLLLVMVCAPVLAAPSVGYRSGYVEALLERPVGGGTVDLLVTAEELDLAGREEARQLRDFVERSLWFAALDEAPPQALTVRDAVTTSSPEGMRDLRTRGTQRLLPFEVIAAQLAGEPGSELSTVADDGYTNNWYAAPAPGLTTLSARFRVTNRGTRTIAAFALTFAVRRDATSSSLFECRWHDHAPLEPMQAREVACRWLGEEAVLRAAAEHLRGLRPADPLGPLGLTNVVFLESGRRVPYALENGFNVGGDPDLMRMAADRAAAATCWQRASCDRELHLLGLFLDFLPWLVIPAILGRLLRQRLPAEERG